MLCFEPRVADGSVRALLTNHPRPAAGQTFRKVFRSQADCPVRVDLKEKKDSL
jgi:hypothetical protein